MKKTFEVHHLVILMSTVAVLAGCVSSAIPVLAPEASTKTSSLLHSSEDATTPAPARSRPPTRLVLQPEGTPLPPRDATIADTWPPELKQLIDNMVALLLKRTEDSAPDIEEVQRRFGITLTEERLSATQQKDWGKRYTLDGVRYGASTDSILFRSFYAIGNPSDASGTRSQKLQLRIDPGLTGFCLNPYELAVYTGWEFSSFNVSTHSNVAYRPPLYAWGMFGGGDSSIYGGPGYYITVNKIKDSAGKVVDADCVYLITTTGLYPKEK